MDEIDNSSEDNSNLMSEVLSLMDKVSSTTKTHPAYDYIAFTQVPKERFEELKKAFVIYDKDKSGKIKTTDLRNVLTMIGQNVDDERKMKKLTISADPNDKGVISFSKFVILVEINQKKDSEGVIVEEEYDEKQKAFSLFEVSGKGYVQISSLKNIFGYLGLDASTDRCIEIIHDFDVKTSGQLSYDDFCELCDKLTADPIEDSTYLSPKRQAELKEIFSLFESDKKDLMFISDLGMAIRCLGLKPTDMELKAIIKDEGLEGEEYLNKSKYYHIMENQMKDSKLDQDGDRFTETEIEELREAFVLFDTDGDGTISSSELGDVMRSLGRSLSKRKLKEMIAIADIDGNGTIEFPELLSLMEQFTVRNTFMDEMKKAFRHFDKDNNGFISPEELKKALLRMKIKLSKVEFILMLNRADTDKDGQISYKEFVVMMISDKNI